MHIAHPCSAHSHTHICMVLLSFRVIINAAGKMNYQAQAGRGASHMLLVKQHLQQSMYMRMYIIPAARHISCKAPSYHDTPVYSAIMDAWMHECITLCRTKTLLGYGLMYNTYDSCITEVMHTSSACLHRALLFISA